MLSQVYYLVRSRIDGTYLVARPQQDSEARFLLVFREHAEALSYLNTHGSELADRLAVESLPGTHLGGLLQRWGFTGIGLVQDPLIPKIEFLITN